MLILGVMHSFNGGIRNAILGHIIGPVADFIEKLYQIIISVAETPILSGSTVYSLFNRVQIMIAVFMVFRIMVSVIMMIVSPDTGKADDGHLYGATKFQIVIKRVMLGLVLLVLIRPVNIPVSSKQGGENQLRAYVHNHGILFGIMYDLQHRVLHNNSIGCLVTGRDCGSEMGKDGNATTKFSDFLIDSFVHPNTDKPDEDDEDAEDNNSNSSSNSSEAETNNSTEVGENNDLSKYKDKKEWTCGDDTKYFDDYNNGKMHGSDFLDPKVYKEDCDVGKGEFTFSYNYMFLLILLVLFAAFLISFVIDVGVRSIKLSILRLISPIPIISYMANDDDTRLSKWARTLVITYAELFIYLALLFLALELIGDLVQNTVLADESVGTFIKIIMVFSMLVFLRMAPNFIKDLLQIAGDSTFGIGARALHKAAGRPGWAAVNTAAAGIGAIREGGNAKHAWDAMTAKSKQNLNALLNNDKIQTPMGAYIGGKDMMARRLTGNKEATAKGLRQGARRANSMNYPEILDQAHQKVDNAQAAYENALYNQDVVKAATQQGWSGLTEQQQNEAISYLSDADKDEYKNITDKINNKKRITPDEAKQLSQLQKQAVSGYQRGAEQDVYKAQRNLESAKSELTEVENMADNLMINRTVEFKTDEEPNIILKTGGRKGGATGTRKNIQYGAHLGDNKTWKEADNQKSG